MALRSAIRSGTEIQVLAFHMEYTQARCKKLVAELTCARNKRGGTLEDHRTKDGN